jgi:CRISPR-associated protein Cmr3
MHTVALLLHPVDALFFRDARPFGAGDHGRSRLPSPQTFAGMLKTHLLRAAGLEPRALHGLHDPPPEQRHWFTRLRFRGPWLYVHSPDLLAKQWPKEEPDRPVPPPRVAGPLFAAPADLFQRDAKNNNHDGPPLCRASVLESPPGWPHRDLQALWCPRDGYEPARGLIDAAGLKTYLAGDPPEHVWKLDAFVGWEDRTGLAMDGDRNTGREGLLYSLSLLRLKPGVCFYGELLLPEDCPGQPDELLPPALCLPWGGEGRRVSLSRPERPFPWRDQTPGEPADLFTTLLLTPGIFANGNGGDGPLSGPWKPSGRAPGALVAAAVPKPEPVSGWDLAGAQAEGHGHAKPTRFTVPAGAVYYWQRGKNAAPEPLPAETPASLCDRPSDRDLGWGLALRGRPARKES